VGPFLLPEAQSIRKAERMVEKIPDAKQRTLAEQFVKDKAQGRNQLVSNTVRQLSQQLHKAKKVEGYMAGVDLGLAKLLADPHIGNHTTLNTAAGHKLELTVEGMRYHDGRLYYAPQGKHSTVQGCKSFLAAHAHKDTIAKAQLKVQKVRDALQKAKINANALRAKIAAGSNKKLEGGEVPAATAKRLQQQRELDQLRLNMAKMMKAKRLAEAVVRRQKAAAIEAAGTRVKAADVRARELELEGREKRLFERETELKAATVRLQATAQALRTARDTTLIMNFPKRQEEIKLRKEQLDAREKQLNQRESGLRLRSKILKAKVDAFNRGVEKSIRNSIHGASMTADRSYNHARAHISDEVDRFSQSLLRLNRKYSNGYGSKIRRKINTSVKAAMGNMKKITQGMNAAAQAAGAKKP